MIQYYLLHKDLQILNVTFFDKMYIFLSNLKKILLKIQNQIFFNNNI